MESVWIQLISLDEDDADGATTARPISTRFLSFLYATSRAGFGEGDRHRSMTGRNFMDANKKIWFSQYLLDSIDDGVAMEIIKQSF